MEVPLYRWMVFVRENLSSKWMITGGTTLFHEISGNQFSDEAIKRCDETNKCSLANKDSVISWGRIGIYYGILEKNMSLNIILWNLSGLLIPILVK